MASLLVAGCIQLPASEPSPSASPTPFWGPAAETFGQQPGTQVEDEAPPAPPEEEISAVLPSGEEAPPAPPAEDSETPPAPPSEETDAPPSPPSEDDSPPGMPQ